LEDEEQAASLQQGWEGISDFDEATIVGSHQGSPQAENSEPEEASSEEEIEIQDEGSDHDSNDNDDSDEHPPRSSRLAIPDFTDDHRFDWELYEIRDFLRTVDRCLYRRNNHHTYMKEEICMDHKCTIHSSGKRNLRRFRLRLKGAFDLSNTDSWFTESGNEGTRS
jgi:hypothetical protein